MYWKWQFVWIHMHGTGVLAGTGFICRRSCWTWTFLGPSIWAWTTLQHYYDVPYTMHPCVSMMCFRHHHHPINCFAKGRAVGLSSEGTWASCRPLAISISAARVITTTGNMKRSSISRRLLWYTIENVADKLQYMSRNAIVARHQVLKAGACFWRPKFTGFCEAFLEGK